MLDWFDKTLMSYDHDTGLAATWATSVDRLTPDARRLLERLAFLAPEPIPDSLLDVAAPGDPEGFDARAARANLFAYSLVSRAAVEAGKAAQDGFAVHRLVQDFARRSMTEERRGEALREALGWVDAAFDGNPQDVRSWPVLDPLAPHALAVAQSRRRRRGSPSRRRGFSISLACYSQAKARYAEAEPLLSPRAGDRRGELRAEIIPNVAIGLNNLADLLHATNRLGEAEPLFRRALAIDEASMGRIDPEVATDLNNLAGLLSSTNRLGEAEPFFAARWRSTRRATGRIIPMWRETSTISPGCSQPPTASARPSRSIAARWRSTRRATGRIIPTWRRDLNNLAGLLRDTNRLGEAEPFYRRALAIYEASYGPDHPQRGERPQQSRGLARRHKSPSARPSRFIAARWRSTRRATGRTIPTAAIRLNNLAGLLRAANRPARPSPISPRAGDRRGELRAEPS